ncbi:MAG: sel1 repeat family protein [Deltaproteobacteria bacterium]|nr:sel1 repeat family protein [Deltaproteobacteria bacterium]
MRWLVLVVLGVLVWGCGGPPRRPPVGGSGGSAGSAATVPATHRVPQTTTDVKVSVTDKKIVMNGIAVSAKPSVADMEAIFGKPDRTWDSGGANKVHTWDRIGLLVYEPYDADGTTGDGRCISATFPFKAMSTSFSPKTMFGGSITLDGQPLAPKLALDAVLKWPGATQPYTSASLVFDRGEFHVFTIEEKKGGMLDLVELSFWQQAREGRVAKPPTVRVEDPDDSTCNAGDPPRCSNIALAMQTGMSGRKNFERAFELAKTACTGGDVFGCVMLGNMHDAGRGTASSKPEAKVAWKRACTLGYKPACELAN